MPLKSTNKSIKGPILLALFQIEVGLVLYNFSKGINSWSNNKKKCVKWPKNETCKHIVINTAGLLLSSVTKSLKANS